MILEPERSHTKESQELAALAERLDENLVHAVEKILGLQGRVIVTAWANRHSRQKDRRNPDFNRDFIILRARRRGGSSGDLGLVRD